MGKWKKSPQELINRFYETLEPFETVEMRKMFGYPCSFVNGNMFTGLHEENWVLRLPEEARDEIIALGAKPFVPMGRPMREYILIPLSIQYDADALRTWINCSLKFASSLLPKEAKKPRKKVSSSR